MSIGPANGKYVATALVLAIATLIATACGGSTQTPGEDQPKRALDPRSEAIRYFPANTESIALLKTDDAESLAALDEAMTDLPGWRAIRQRARHSLRAAGIDPREILELSRIPADDIDLPPPEIAFGTVPGSGSDEERALLTLATEQGVELDRIFREAAEAGGLSAAGEFDGARLYRGPDLDFAIRDGVLIAAADVNRLQQAIARRDGDRTAQLDDSPITALINTLPENATLSAYSGAGFISERVFGLITEALATSRDETADGDTGMPGLNSVATESALTARGQDGDLAVDLVVKVDEDDEAGEPSAEEQPESNEEPIPIAIPPAAIDAALSDLPPDAPLRNLRRLGQLAGAAWIDGDQLHARLITAP